MPSSDCDLCDEVAQRGRAITGRLDQPFSRLVHRSSGIDVLAGLGSLAAGYMLVIPHEHVRSAGELAPPAADRFWGVAKDYARRVSEAFSCTAFLVEHGSSGSSDEGRSCIEHAHAHIFPVPEDVELAAFSPSGAIAANEEDLAEIAGSGNNYFYCTDLSNGLLARTNNDFTSQFARTRWATVLGRTDEWDWAVFPEYDHIRETVQGVGDVSFNDESRLAETVATYNTSTDWYLARTQSYLPDSHLRDDIERFVAACPPGPLLDAGAGGGRDTTFMGSMRRTVLALDLAGKLLRRSTLLNDEPRVEGDVRHLPFKPASLAGVWCSAVLLHLPEKQSVIALEEFARAMVPGGRLHISVKYGSGCSTTSVPGRPSLRRHFYLYDEPQMRHMVTATGFRIDRLRIQDEPDDSSRERMTTWLKCTVTRIHPR